MRGSVLRFARQSRLNDCMLPAPSLRPHLVEGPAESCRMLWAEDRRKTVIVEERKIRAPRNTDRLPGADHQVGNDAKALRPRWQRAERGCRPVMRLDAPPHLAPVGQPGGSFRCRWNADIRRFRKRRRCPFQQAIAHGGPIPYADVRKRSTTAGSYVFQLLGIPCSWPCGSRLQCDTGT